MESIDDYIDKIEDPRHPRGIRYPFKDIVVICCFAILSGSDNATGIVAYVDESKEYFSSVFGIKKIPSHDTISRIMRLINFEYYASCLGDFIVNAYPTKFKKYGGKKVIHIDGKANRAASKKSEGEKPRYLMNSYVEGGSISLYSEEVGDKNNEITAIPKFLDSINIKDSIVTIDAIGMQQDILNKIVGEGGDFVIALKENQPELLKLVTKQFDNELLDISNNNLESYTSEVNKAHGRIEKRTAYLIRDTEFILKKYGIGHAFNNIGTCLLIEKEVSEKVKGEYVTTTSKSFALSSLTNLGVKELLEIKLSHWSIESSRWLLDVQFNEDKHTARRDNAPINFSTLRKFALAIKKGDEGSNKLTTKQFFIRNLLHPENIEKLLGLVR